MPRRLLGVFLLLLVSVSFARAQGEVVLFNVGSESVSRHEFEYHFAKSTEKRADVFIKSYARFKQKVQYAKELKLDTLSTFRKQKEQFETVLKESSSLAAERKALPSEQGWIKLLHITYPLKQIANKFEQKRGLVYMDSLYITLQKNADLVIKECLWIQNRYLLNEWREQLSHLEKGEYSKPFYSPLGIHIVAWIDKRDVVSNGENLDKDVALRIQEVEEGLLTLALDDYWDRTLVCSEKDLRSHFKKYRTDYGGGIPHFRGAVIHCKDRKKTKEIKKYLKRYSQSQWKEAVGQMPEQLAKGCKVEVGLFAINTNPYVDKLVFKCGSFDPLEDYPYSLVLGKKLKDGPSDYLDVRLKVEQDCREAKKKAEMEAFESKNKVEIDEYVLKTVNRAENK